MTKTKSKASIEDGKPQNSYFTSLFRTVTLTYSGVSGLLLTSCVRADASMDANRPDRFHN